MRVHWRVLVVLWVFLCVVASRPVLAQDAGGGDATPACVLCAGAKSVACPTCAGKGRGPQTCEVCWGEGRRRCDARVDPRASAAERDAMEEFGHKGTEIRCTNDLCRDGRVKFDDGKSYQCRLCGGRGLLKCVDCRDATLPCAVCKGRKTVDGPCDDCAGTGKLACVVCAEPDAKCGQCAGAGNLPCSRCDHVGNVVQPCIRCGGRGQSNCVLCVGIGKVVCAQCFGTARFRSQYTDGTTASSTKCGACEERGTIECGTCKKGIVKCATCQGLGSAFAPCRACRGSSRIACRACGSFGYRVGELEAGLIAKKGLKAEAAALLDVALAHARASAASAEAAIGKVATAAAPTLPAPTDLTKPGAIEEYLKALRESLRQRMEDLVRLVQARFTVREFTDAVARMEAALAKLRPPTPAVPPKAPPK
ncbi:MAG: hypothetical protein K8T90_11510 [Planctomycetes bacterium]|nr:hypothetical protein [Planctomycetota bacterium]